jgi:phosphoadenosine phosphosulfate reductase
MDQPAAASQHDLPRLADMLAGLDLDRRMAAIAGLAGRKVFTTSLGIEDQVLTAAIAATGGRIEIVTLDTRRLFPETRELIVATERRLGISIRRMLPDTADVDSYVAKFGRDGFYDSVEARHACCDIRKLRPLARALAGADFWITGVRRGQSDQRSATPLVQHDAARGLIKLNPLADITLDEIRAYATARSVPLNPLHERGYPSIGCEPCTRAIKPGEPERAGRWWWENDQTRECGLHVDGQVKSTALQGTDREAIQTA